MGTTRTGWTHAEVSRLPSVRARTWFSCEALLQYYQSLHTLHLDTGYWGDLNSLDGKRYFVAAGLRVQHETVVAIPGIRWSEL